MKAAVLFETDQLPWIGDVTIDMPAADEMLLGAVATDICRSNLSR